MHACLWYSQYSLIAAFWRSCSTNLMLLFTKLMYFLQNRFIFTSLMYFSVSLLRSNTNLYQNLETLHIWWNARERQWCYLGQFCDLMLSCTFSMRGKKIIARPLVHMWCENKSFVSSACNCYTLILPLDILAVFLRVLQQLKTTGRIVFAFMN